MVLKHRAKLDCKRSDRVNVIGPTLPRTLQRPESGFSTNRVIKKTNGQSTPHTEIQNQASSRNQKGKQQKRSTESGGGTKKKQQRESSQLMSHRSRGENLSQYSLARSKIIPRGAPVGESKDQVRTEQTREERPDRFFSLGNTRNPVPFYTWSGVLGMTRTG